WPTILRDSVRLRIKHIQMTGPAAEPNQQDRPGARRDIFPPSPPVLRGRGAGGEGVALERCRKSPRKRRRHRRQHELAPAHALAIARSEAPDSQHRPPRLDGLLALAVYRVRQPGASSGPTS